MPPAGGSPMRLSSLHVQAPHLSLQRPSLGIHRLERSIQARGKAGLQIASSLSGRNGHGMRHLTRAGARLVKRPCRRGVGQRMVQPALQKDRLVSIHVHGRQHRHVDIRVGSSGLEQSPGFAEIGQGRDVIAKEAANFTATDQRREVRSGRRELFKGVVVANECALEIASGRSHLTQQDPGFTPDRVRRATGFDGLLDHTGGLPPLAEVSIAPPKQYKQFTPVHELHLEFPLGMLEPPKIDVQHLNRLFGPTGIQAILGHPGHSPDPVCDRGHMYITERSQCRQNIKIMLLWILHDRPDPGSVDPVMPRGRQRRLLGIQAGQPVKEAPGRHGRPRTESGHGPSLEVDIIHPPSKGFGLFVISNDPLGIVRFINAVGGLPETDPVSSHGVIVRLLHRGGRQEPRPRESFQMLLHEVQITSLHGC